LEMQSKCAKADSHVHRSWKAHSQGPSGAGPGAPIGEAAGEGAGPPTEMLRFIAFWNEVRRINSLRDVAPQTASKAPTTKWRPVIELELTENY